ncbi:ParB/RepB/Spo0J family partition protein [Gimesia fumaroli]|jgi:ParB family chromosome partitioning protein|uniref:Putative chromosome-partitioning protein ParB n=1 Tax=Gimesia fumaroli TaxID=2527976 RepID=A0A518IJI0_9PLAN|nr:ParB/RepB/Spo0J family partition protein [Gimesia fumaroli]QDV53249.1 putative chromosome-partitioning protein ParB [Gimesia fumaroli]
MEDQNQNPTDNPAEQSETPGAPRRRLGRGLNALLGRGGEESDSDNQEAGATGEATEAFVPAEQDQIDVDLIERNPYQPRQDFEADSLKELEGSIRQHGVLQPLLVRPFDGAYQLIAGERRLKAAREAGLKTVPCRVLNLEERQVCEVAIEENLKRKDLNVLEKAQAFKNYLSQFDSTIEQLAQRLSLDRSTVNNMIRLLDLAEPVKQALHAEKISAGHARTLLSLDEQRQISMCEQIQSESLSVRKTEAEVRKILKGEADTVPFESTKKTTETPQMTNHLVDLQQQLREILGAQVEIKLKTDHSGQILIPFDSNETFERITGVLRKSA